MTLPGLAFLLGGISTVAGLFTASPLAIALGSVAMIVAYRQGRAP